ncbi:hypothetical protein [Streptomyces sp. NPDC048224]|uniref:hypothetical protein n=1 Tax=Streptomyces sp. NPDC048224 TaxID=3154500 RepID=UPI0033C4C8EC
MRRRTGAAGIAVAIAAIVPLADPAPAQALDSNLESDCLSSTYQEAVPIGLEADPGAPDPLCPDALFDAPPDDAPLVGGGLDDDRLDGGGLDDGRLDGSGLGDGRPDEGLPDGGGLAPGRPGDGRLDQNRPGTSHSTGQGPFDQGGIREIREGDGGMGGGAAHPRGDQLPTISATTRPAPVTTPAPATTAPAPVSSPSVAPTLGTQGGLGGASGTGPSDWDIGIGLSFVTGAALAAGWVIRRRRRA